MKKLLFTAIAAAGAAFGLQAEASYLAGTGFEDDGLGTYVPSSTLWTVPADATKYTADVIETEGSYSKDCGYPDDYVEADHSKNLKVKTTFGNPLNMKVATAQSIKDGAYFDSMVKFTACDEAPTTDSYSDAKIVVWYQETDAEGSTAGVTNFFVKASKWNGEAWGAETYKCAAVDGFDLTAWHRLTIKSIADIKNAGSEEDYTPGFVVYVDGDALVSTDAILAIDGLNDNAAKFNETGKLFVSLVQGDDAAKNTIASVGFDGQGELDDLAITADAPDFAKDFEFFTIDLGTNVTGFNYAITGGDSGSATSSLQLPYAANMVVTISGVTCNDGFMFSNLTADTGVTVDNDNDTFTVTLPNLHGVVNAQAAAASFNGNSYATIAKAAEAANAITTAGDYTLKLWNDCTTGGLDIDNATEGVNIIIDLAGKTITGTADDTAAIAISAGNVMITNSNEAVEGTVNVGDATAAVAASGGNVLITAGTYNGIVSLDGAVSAVITGGKFDDVNNDADALKDFLADGLALVDDNGYYVVSPYAPAGDGESPETAFEIDSVQALNWVKDQVAAGNTFAGKFLKQTADIDFDGAVFEGIGEVKKDNISGDNSFQGTYNGQGLTISNFKFPADKTYRGFFNTLVGSAVVKNLTFETLGFDTATVNEWGAGIAAGSIQGPVTLQNITTKGAITGCHNTAGIAAKATTKDGTPSFIACTNEATIVNNYTQNPKAGGIIALCEGATFVDCYNKGAITVTHKKVTNTDYGGAVGGLVAWMQSSNSSITGGGNEGTISVGNLEADGTAGVTCGSLIGSVAGQTTTIAAGVKTLSNQLAVGGMGSPKTPDDGTLVGGMFVADGVTVTPVKNGSYKVVAPRAVVPAIELGAGETLTIETTLATAVDTAVTAASGLDLVTDKTTAVWTYSTKATEIPVSSITIDQGETAEVEVGKTITLTATVKPDDATDPTVTWTSGDTSKATVVDGVVTGVAAGDVDITAKAGDKTDTIKITVKAAGGWDPTVDPSVKASDKIPALAGTPLANVSFKDLSSWAADKKVDFSDAGNIKVEAFLLNCENDETKVAEAKAAFKFSAEDLAALMKGGDDAEAVKAAFETNYPYAAVEVKNSNVLPLDSAKEADGNAGFYQAVLSVKPAPEPVE